MREALRPGGRLAGIVYSTPEANGFFSIPVSIIRRRAQLPAPAPGQPGPFSLGAPGVIEAALEQGLHRRRGAPNRRPKRLASTAEYVRFARESFGALHQMLAGLSEAEREEAWSKIERERSQYETADGFDGPCELVVAAGTPGVGSGRPARHPEAEEVETAGIEPASAIAREVASTSVAGALVSSRGRHAGGVPRDQPP